MDVQKLSVSAPSDAELTAEQKLYWLNALQVVGNWSVHDDGDGRLFYYDRKTALSQWEVPDDLTSLETEFMMKLMLQHAVARSGSWTAHDAGNGTLYYFNATTRTSAWERPSEWGEAEAVAAAKTREREEMADAAKKVEEKEENQKKEKALKKTEKKKKKQHKKLKEEQARLEETKEKHELEEEEEEESLTAEELQAQKERSVREQKRMEQFCAMLRDKNIMPFCKWSVALPQIAGDPRFMSIPTMEQRRTIFEDFVKHRREDLQAEKKSKLKHAKHLFTQLLREQFQLDSWEPNTTLSVFLSTLEDSLKPERYKQIQDDVLALLTLSAQERIYLKAVAAYKSEALKRDGEQLRLTKFLEDKLAKEDKVTLQWESDKVQKLVREFYSSTASDGALLSDQKQRQVFDELIARMVCDQALKCRGANEQQSKHTQPRRRSPSRDKKKDASTRRDRRASSPGRRRSRSRSLRRCSRSHSGSRSPSHERGKRHHSRKSSRRRSPSSSRSRSRERSSRRLSRHRRRYSPSPYRDRSRTR